MKVLHAAPYIWFITIGYLCCAHAEPMHNSAFTKATGDAPVLPFSLSKQPSPLAILPQPLVTPHGHTVWVYEHHDSNLVTLTITFLDAGSKNEEGSITDKQAVSGTDAQKGLLKLLELLLEEGAGSYSGEEFKKFLIENHIRFSGDANRDTFSLTLSMPHSNLAQGLEVVRLILTDLHLDQDDVKKMQERLSVYYKHDMEDPITQGFEALQQQMFGLHHPYTQSTQTYLDNLPRITPSHIHDYMQEHFTQDRIMVSICGPISKVAPSHDLMSQADVLKELNDIFQRLPDKPDPSQRTFTIKFQNLGSTHHVQMNIPQSNIIFAHPGLNRDDPDFMAMELALNVFGNSDFSARLMHSIREKAGLVYGISMNQWVRKEGSLLLGMAATRFENVHTVIDMIQKEWENFIEYGITEKEFRIEQQRMIASLPLRLSSSENIVKTLSSMQTYNLGHDYLQTRNETIKNLTLKHVNEVLKKRLNPHHLTYVTVGKTPLNDAPHAAIPLHNKEEASS